MLQNSNRIAGFHPTEKPFGIVFEQPYAAVRGGVAREGLLMDEVRPIIVDGIRHRRVIVFYGTFMTLLVVYEKLARPSRMRFCAA